MSDLIRREDAIENLCGCCLLGKNRMNVCIPPESCMCKEALKTVPAVDTVETRSGRWIIKKSGAYCSECKGKVRIGDANSYVYCVSQTEKLIKKPRYKICPFCGAHMDGGEKNG